MFGTALVARRPSFWDKVRQSHQKDSSILLCDQVILSAVKSDQISDCHSKELACIYPDHNLLLIISKFNLSQMFLSYLSILLKLESLQ